MNRIIRADERHFSDFGWLKTYWLFSFSEYHDPENVRFGPLRVFNDDVVSPGEGFPMHHHEEMEIITVILEGELTHEDSMGHRAAIKAGQVQRITAGTGIEHSEFNLGGEPVHLYQIWIIPSRKGLKPSYEQKGFDPGQWRGRLFPVASGRGDKDAVSFHADAAIYRCSLEPGRETVHETDAGRRVFVYLTEGKAEVGGETLGAGDQARLEIKGSLALKARESSELVLIDLP